MPRTEAGKTMAVQLRELLPHMPLTWEAIDIRIEDIEAEAAGEAYAESVEATARAVAAERARIRAAVDEMDGPDRNPNAHPEVRRGWRQARAAVLAIIDREEPPMTDRDRPAADIRDALLAVESHDCAHSAQVADRLIALGWHKGIDEGLMVVPKPHEGAHIVEVAEVVFRDWMARTKDGKALTMLWGEPDEYGMYTPVWTMVDDGMVMVPKDAMLDEERLARALQAVRREKLSPALRAEGGFAMLWEGDAAAIAKAYREDTDATD